MPYICNLPPADMEGTFVDDGAGGYRGECVSLVKKQCPLIPGTAHWRKSLPAKGSTSLLPGTAIATFDAAGRFESGRGHAAIYVGQSSSGIEVWDQYNHPPKPVGRRTLQFNDGKADVNNGNKFCVIEMG